MSGFLGMGGYGVYVWSSYVVFLIVLLIDVIAPYVLKQQTLKVLKGYYLRQRKRSETRSHPSDF